MSQPQQRRTMDYTPDPNKFDLRTHHWNGQGQLMKLNLYTCHVVEGRQYYERPINSGNLWFENNQPAGRVTYKDGVKNIDVNAAHMDYVQPLDGAEKLHFELVAEKSRTAELEAELAAIKADRAPKVEVAAAVVHEAELKTEMPSLKSAVKGKA